MNDRAGNPSPRRHDDSPRMISWRVLGHLLDNPAPVDQHLDQVFRQRPRQLTAGTRAQVTNLVNGCVKYRRRLDWLISRLAHRQKKISRKTRALLQLALFELSCNDGIPPYAVVSETVNLARKVIPGREGFVNGLLRTYLRHAPEDLLPPSDTDPATRLAIIHSLPDWLVKLWLADYGLEIATRLCRQANDFSGTTFRINCHRGERSLLLQQLAREKGISCTPTPLAPYGCTTKQAGELIASDFFRQGYLTAQDEGAQLIGYLLNPQPGQRILDACAAPGGKTCHLAELSGNRALITAADRSPERLRLVNENAARLQLQNITTVTADLRRPVPGFTPGSFAAILVDAPCSGLGVLRRRSDLRWRKKAADIPRLATIQLQILANCSRYLEPGGRLVYATCTSSRSENQEVVRSFLQQHPDFYQLPATDAAPDWLAPWLDEDGCLQTFLLPECQMDGFFAVVLSRR